MTFKKLCLILSVASLVMAVYEEDWFLRVVFLVHTIAYVIAFDLIKDVEKAKRKERDLTEIRMEKEMLAGWEESLEGRWNLMTAQIANTADTLLKQLATYVRVGTPDHIERMHHDEPRVRQTTDDTTH